MTATEELIEWARAHSESAGDDDVIDAAVEEFRQLHMEVRRLRAAAPHVDVPMVYAYELGLADGRDPGRHS